MVDKGSSSSFAITSCYTYHLGVGISSGKLNLADNMCIQFDELLDDGHLVRNAGTLDYFIGIKNLFGRVVSLFPSNAVVIKHLLVMILDDG